MKRRPFLLGLAGAMGSLALPGARAQQSWPARPITIINPFPAGGGTDAFARPLSAQLTRQLKQQVIVDNRGGAGGTLGASLAAKAAPDGYTFFMGAVHHAIAPSLYKKLDYDIERDFVPITMVASVPQVLVVNPGRVAANDLPAFIAHLKRNPGKLNYGSAGNGTSHHLAGELFKLLTNTFVVHIPYRGAGPALQDLLAGQVDMMFDGLGSSAAHIRAGRIKPLAVAAPERVLSFSGIPTAKEGGVPGWEVSTWYAFWAPKGTPKEITAQMHAELVKALGTQELKDVWSNQGARAGGESPEQFAAFVHAEIKKWADVVQRSGVKLD